jgi:hypothetical protein
LRLAAYLVLGCALMLLATLPVTMKFVHGHWVWVQPRAVADAMDAWRYGVEHVALVIIFLLLFAAADLGSLGMGESAARRDYDFLLTRPRARRHFVWSAFLAGMAQLCLLVLVSLAVALATLLVLTSHVFPRQACLLTSGALALGALAFSSAFALSLATGSTRSGFELAFCALIVYYTAREVTWRASIWGYLGGWEAGQVYAHGAYDWLLTHQHVNLPLLCLMIATTAILPFVAQFGFERKDL